MPDDPVVTEPTDPPAAPPAVDPPPSDPPKDPPVVSPPANDDWRESIQDDKLRKFAGEHTSVQHLAERALSLRKELSTAIMPLGKKPTDEQLTVYRKATGVPEKAEEYVFDTPDGKELTEADKAFRAAAATEFHRLHISADKAKDLGLWWNDISASLLKAEIDADKAYADETEATLKREWPGGEFEINKQLADRAVAHLFGEKLDEVRNIQTKDGRFVLDNSNFLRIFAQLGREMESRGPLVPMSDGERKTVGETATEIRKKAQEAHARGEYGEADRLSEEERQLYERRDGDQPIIGVDQRVA